MKKIKVPTINNFGPIQTKEGEYIEEKVRRITENGEPIEDGAPIIYTERKNGVNPAYNIRTDRWEIAQDAMEQVGNNKSKIIAMKIAQRENTGENQPAKAPNVISYMFNGSHMIRLIFHLLMRRQINRFLRINLNRSEERRVGKEC